MAFQAILGCAPFHFFVALDARRMGRPIGPWNHLLMDNITMTVDASEFRLLDVQSVGNLNIPVNLSLFLLDIPMTPDAVLIDEVISGKKLVGKELIWLGMTVGTGYAGGVNRLGPHHDSGLLDMAMETYAGESHEYMSGGDSKGYPQNDDTWENPEEKPFFLHQKQDGTLYEVSDFHNSDSSSMVSK